MASVVASLPTVVRTERGLSITGTRITLYDVMDYVVAEWPAHLIRDRLQLTDRQISDAMAYIDAHSAEVRQEYEEVLRISEENRRYWEERNRDRSGCALTSPDSPDQAELRAKLAAWKAGRDSP